MNAEMYEVLESLTLENGTRVEILQFPKLIGSADLRTAQNLFFAAQSGMRLKMVRISLAQAYVRVEPGAMYFMKGQLETKASAGGGFIKGLTRKVLSGETFFVNEVHGTGDIYLEPTFGHFILYEIKKNEKAIIVDKRSFFAGRVV